MIEFTDRDQMRIEPRHRRQPATNSRQRQPVRGPDRGHVARQRTRPLSTDELQHITTTNLNRIAVDHGEEHLQVVRDRQCRVRPQPGMDRLEILINQPVAEGWSQPRTLSRDCQRWEPGLHGDPPITARHHQHDCQQKQAERSPTYLPKRDVTESRVRFSLAELARRCCHLDRHISLIDPMAAAWVHEGPQHLRLRPSCERGQGREPGKRSELRWWWTHPLTALRVSAGSDFGE